jgi:beta-N-acetylhexosaminidase
MRLPSLILLKCRKSIFKDSLRPFTPSAQKMIGKISRGLVILVFCIANLLPAYSVGAQTPVPPVNQLSAKSLLNEMTPEEKVGQLFLVTFKGTDTTSASQIYDLVSKKLIGGVVLSAANSNFPASETQITDAFKLINSIQQIRLDTAANQSSYHSIPLFIGISQEGDLFPNDQILTGLTSMPDAMAIGATWKPELAQKVGSVYGDELHRLGINLYLGPSVDVLDNSPGTRIEDLGVRTFGGDPFWVGEMGKSFIAGLHQGSEGRMVVVSKHFPGRGGSDRPADEEVATVRKSLEQLKQIELAPFFSVTSSNISPEMVTDGLSVSHIRYQGFQGNIRATTKPVSFDTTALSQLMALPQFQPWRDAGGLLVSDDLGSAAIRKFFDPSGLSFDARQVARNALLAGNDILYANNFISSGDADSYTTLVKTLEFFTQKYREDPAFAQRVDTSVERILASKFKLYPQFNASSILLPEEGISRIGTSQQVAFEVAQQAVTLISPSEADLTTVLVRPPELQERILFFTDVVSGQQCPKCPEQVSMTADAMQKAVLKLYGPQAGGQVSGGRMTSYSFADLEQMLSGADGTDTIASDIRQAAWIVFSFQKISVDRPVSLALKRFLSERPDLVRDKKLVAFAFNAPYYLDSTDISKLTAYYSVYSKIPTFIDVAARVLFQEIPPVGILPVSVPGIGYDLSKATTPNPSQVIPLTLDLPEPASTPEAQNSITVTPTQVPLFNVGDNLPIKAGVILDQNGKPVPDGTVVKFIYTLGDEKSIIQQVETETSGGIARTAFRIQNPGLLEVRVTSESAITSQILRLDVSGTGGAQVTAIAPTPIPSETVEPSPTIPPSITPEPTLSPSEIRTRSFGGWLAGLMVLIGLVLAAYQLGSRRISVRWGVRFALLTALMGSFGLVIYGLTPIGKPFPEIWNALIFSVSGGLSGSFAGWVWYQYPKWMSEKPE